IFGTAHTGYVVSQKVPNAGIYSLGSIATEPAIASLLELQRTVKHAGFRTRINAALAAAARSAGLSPGELAERVVPDAGLDDKGQRIVITNGATARVTIGPNWRVLTEWQTQTGWSGKAPAEIEPGADKPVKLAAKEVR